MKKLMRKLVVLQEKSSVKNKKQVSHQSDGLLARPVQTQQSRADLMNMSTCSFYRHGSSDLESEFDYNISMSNVSSCSRSNRKFDKVRQELDKVTQFKKVLIDDCEIKNYEKDFKGVIVSNEDEDEDEDESSVKNTRLL